KPADDESATDAEGDEEEEQPKSKRSAKSGDASSEGEHADGAEASEGGDDGSEGSERRGEEGAEAAGRKEGRRKAAGGRPRDDGDDDYDESPSKAFAAFNRAIPPRRYAYVVGVLLGGVGLVFAYQSQGEATRAQTVPSAREAQRAISDARGSAGLANVMYGLA